ncbi:MAG: ribokinase [Opitutales bacterium]|nr:ribokinase [Opitutales bacterium]
MPRILNFGSINIDHVYQVPHFVRPGETLSSGGYTTGFGGKGFNQSVALARAGARVIHAGAVGPDGTALVERLRREGVDPDRVASLESPTGHAVIQVTPDGQNAIVIHGGANARMGSGDFNAFFAGLGSSDHFLCQNETSAVPESLSRAREDGLTVWFNPAPMHPAVSDYPFEAVDWLLVNETEGGSLSGAETPDSIVETLRNRFPHLSVVLTLGGEGVIVVSDGVALRIPAERVSAVDTTAAGDTFIGFFVAAVMDGVDLEAATRRAVRAAAMCVTRPGASGAIPHMREL